MFTSSNLYAAQAILRLETLIDIEMLGPVPRGTLLSLSEFYLCCVKSQALLMQIHFTVDVCFRLQFGIYIKEEGKIRLIPSIVHGTTVSS